MTSKNVNKNANIGGATAKSQDAPQIDMKTQLEYAEKIACEVLGIGLLDLYAIYKMEQAHPGTLNRVSYYLDEYKNVRPYYGFFVMAVKDVALYEVKDVITKEDARSFEDMQLDDNYYAWGGIIEFGYYFGNDKELNHERQELFSYYVKGTITREEFVKKYIKLLRQ
jgi:hypothetical protein